MGGSSRGRRAATARGSATHDQGAGIPKTLPLTFGEQVRERVAKGWVAHDGRMIEVAHQLSRSETGDSHRGLGAATRRSAPH